MSLDFLLVVSLNAIEIVAPHAFYIIQISKLRIIGITFKPVLRLFPIRNRQERLGYLLPDENLGGIHVIIVRVGNPSLRFGIQVLLVNCDCWFEFTS